MQKLLNPQEARINGEVVPLFLLWSREGSLDNRQNTWFTLSHFVQVIWMADAFSAALQVGRDETIKAQAPKKGTIFSFFTLSPENPIKAESSSSGKAKNSPAAGQENRNKKKRMQNLTKGLLINPKLYLNASFYHSGRISGCSSMKTKM